MARTMALCSLPRTNPGAALQYKRVNGPFKLVMIAGADCKLPFGNLPRLLLAWVSTEAVRTQSRELVLGRSLSEFMRALGLEPVGGGATGARTRLRNQMRRLFNAHVQLVYADEQGEARVSSSVAPTGPSSGGPSASLTSRRCGRARSIWARRSSTRSSTTPSRSI